MQAAAEPAAPAACAAGDVVPAPLAAEPRHEWAMLKTALADHQIIQPLDEETRSGAHMATIHNYLLPTVE